MDENRVILLLEEILFELRSISRQIVSKEEYNAAYDVKQKIQDIRDKIKENTKGERYGK